MTSSKNLRTGLHVLPGRELGASPRRDGDSPVPTRTFQQRFGIRRWRTAEGRDQSARGSPTRQSEWVAQKIDQHMQPSNESALTDLNVPIEKRPMNGNSHAGSIPEERGTRHCGKNGIASPSADNTRAAARPRSPELPGRTAPPAAEPATIWRLDDA